MLLLSACGGESNPDSMAKPASGKPTNTPVATLISPEELAKHSAESSGYAMKVLAVEDPGKASASYKAGADTRMVAVQVEFTNVSSNDKMLVDAVNALVTDVKKVDYVAVPVASHEAGVKTGELAKGEKASGWVSFTVPKDTKLKSITYRVGLISVVEITVDLPAQ